MRIPCSVFSFFPSFFILPLFDLSYILRLVFRYFAPLRLEANICYVSVIYQIDLSNDTSFSLLSYVSNTRIPFLGWFPADDGLDGNLLHSSNGKLVCLCV